MKFCTLIPLLHYALPSQQMNLTQSYNQQRFQRVCWSNYAILVVSYIALLSPHGTGGGIG
jgi:hypothetical protein